jgi:glutamate-1-semialdehyde 2,1-aminomutase
MRWNFFFLSDFAAVAERFVKAARAMQDDGWWSVSADERERPIKQQILRETIKQFLSRRR